MSLLSLSSAVPCVHVDTGEIIDVVVVIVVIIVVVAVDNTDDVEDGVDGDHCKCKEGKRRKS